MVEGTQPYELRTAWWAPEAGDFFARSPARQGPRAATVSADSRCDLARGTALRGLIESDAGLATHCWPTWPARCASWTAAARLSGSRPIRRAAPASRTARRNLPGGSQPEGGRLDRPSVEASGSGHGRVSTATASCRETGSGWRPIDVYLIDANTPLTSASRGHRRIRVVTTSRTRSSPGSDPPARVRLSRRQTHFRRASFDSHVETADGTPNSAHSRWCQPGPLSAQAVRRRDPHTTIRFLAGGAFQ